MKYTYYAYIKLYFFAILCSLAVIMNVKWMGAVASVEILGEGVGGDLSSSR